MTRKLWDIIRDDLGYSIDCTDEIVDAVDEDGYHWSAQMTHQEEPWIIYKEIWKKDPQQPYDL